MMTFWSVRENTVAELEIKRSKFIAWVSPIYSQQEAEGIIAAAKQRWPGATHYCFAWIIKDPVMERCSDDGEPSGTAGLPILSVLKQRQLRNIIAIVIRYFGGTLLGASGLIHAYADSTRAALDNADLVQYEPGLLIKLIIEYSALGLIQHRFLSLPEVQVRNIDYGERVEIKVLLPARSWERWEKEITELTAGRGETQIMREEMVSHP